MAQCSDKRISKRIYKTKIGVKIFALSIFFISLSRLLHITLGQIIKIILNKIEGNAHYGGWNERTND